MLEEGNLELRRRDYDVEAAMTRSPDDPNRERRDPGPTCPEHDREGDRDRTRAVASVVVR
jgi:hypothetical protein